MGSFFCRKKSIYDEFKNIKLLYIQKRYELNYDIVVKKMEYIDVINQLTKRLSQKRLQHSIGVSKTAELLAERFGCDMEKAKLAGIFHDLAREFPKKELLPRAQAFGIVVNDIEQAEPVLLHAPLAAKMVQSEFGIDDVEILQAIQFHTVAGVDMTKLDKIIYVADAIEPNRTFRGVDELREMAQHDLDAVMLAVLEQSICYIVEAGGLLHPATVAARNQMLLQKMAY